MEEKVYPSPLALHEEVISNGTVFMDTLRKFHSTMGTRFMIPILGGKDLDLHVLYVEVTKRGGFEKVYKEKRLREVIQVFNFPPTTTSAAYVLRKYYNSLLHHYEQVYFFRLQGKLIPSAVPAPVKKSHCERPMPSAIESPPNSMRLNLEQQQQMVWNRGEAFSSLEIRFPILKTPPKKPAMPPPVSVQLPLLALRQQQQLMVCERREGVSTPKLGGELKI